MHLWVLQRAAAEVGPVFTEARFVKAVIAGKLLADDLEGSIERRFHQAFADFSPVMSAGKHDECVGVEVFAPVQRLALGIDAVEPATMFGVVEMPLQRAKQGCGPLCRSRLLDTAAEQVQLTRAGHRPVALHWQRAVRSIQGLVGQGHFGIPAGAQPHWHDAFGEVLVEAGQFGWSGAGVGHECARHNRQCAMVAEVRFSPDYPNPANAAHRRR
ncbi:hypothetical protein D3C78_373190 [compost metagenome]